MEKEVKKNESAEISVKEENLAAFELFQKRVLEFLRNEGVFGARSERLSDTDHLRCVFYSCFEEEKTPETRADPFEMWQNWFYWRKNYEKSGIAVETIRSELDTRKAFWHKEDKLGHPCLIVKVRRNIVGSCPIHERMRFFMYMLDQGLQLARKNGKDKITVIWDREGFVKERNFDQSFHDAISDYRSMIEYNYMERVHKIYVLNIEWFFRMMYSVAKPFLKKKTSSKLELLGDSKDLKAYFDDDCLLIEHGGTSDADKAMNEKEKAVAEPGQKN